MSLHEVFRKRLTSEWFAVVGAVISVVAGLVVFFFTGFDKPQVPDLRLAKLEMIESRMARVENDLDQLEQQLQALFTVSDEAKMAVQFKTIDTTLADLKVRHSKLEDVILNNPAKAIEVPLLRKDLDNLKDAQQQNMLAVKQGIDQVYDLNKWLLGAMAVSIVTLAISNLLKGREKEKPTEG